MLCSVCVTLKLFPFERRPKIDTIVFFNSIMKNIHLIKGMGLQERTFFHLRIYCFPLYCDFCRTVWATLIIQMESAFLLV